MELTLKTPLQMDTVNFVIRPLEGKEKAAGLWLKQFVGPFVVSSSVEG